MNLEWIRYGLEELKFLRSINDLKICYNQKLPFFIRRFRGSPIIDTDIPPILQIEPTNYCNLKCICCPTSRMKRKKGIMDLVLFQKIINDASEIGVNRINLFLHGESMMHPKIVDMIRYIKLKGLGITMITNGMLLNRKKIEAILHSGVNSSDYFIFSILGNSKEIHEKVMKGVKHEKVISNLLYFLELRKKHKVNGPIIEIVFYRMPENEHEINEFIQKWQGIADHLHPIFDTSKQFSEYKIGDNSIPIRIKTCKPLWERMTIFWNGDVTRCNADVDGDYVFDNLKEKSIKEIWNSNELLSIKKMHKESKFRELNLCSNCDWS